MKSSNTKYEAVKQELIKLIDNGTYLPLSKLPSENQLCELFDVSVLTARRAFSELVNEGIVFRVRGKGTFVSSDHGEFYEEVCQRFPVPSDRVVTLIILHDDKFDSSLFAIINGARKYLNKQGFQMTIEYSDDDSYHESLILDRCIQNRIAGVLVFSANPDNNSHKFLELHKHGIPYVLIDRGMNAMPCMLISSYHFDGAYNIAKHLMELGHEKIAFLGCILEVEAEKERLRAYKTALSQKGISVDENLCISDSLNKFNEIYKLIKKEGVTALMCVNDKTALGVMSFLAEKGMKIPEDISITGFDDNEASKNSSPSLTTVRQDFELMASIAAEKLLGSIFRNIHYSQTFLPVEMIIRNSTQKVGKEKLEASK